MKTSPRSFARTLPLIVAVAAVTCMSARATSPSIWDGGGANDNWNNAANWGGNVPVPGTAYDLQFGGSTRLTPVNDFAAASNFRHITFNSGAGAFSISGNSITLNGGITNNSTSAQTISLPLVIAATRNIATVGDVRLGGGISGAGGLTIQGTGIVTASAKNTFTGALTENGGILVLPAGGSMAIANNFIIGQLAAHSGAMRITGGAMTNTQATGTGNMMVGRQGFGSLELSAGTVKVNQAYVGWTAGYGTLLINGGSLYCGTGSDYFVIGTTSGGAGSVTVSSGLFSHTGANRAISLNNNGDSRGEINMLGGDLNNAGGVISFGLNTAAAAVGTGSGIVSLNGGTLTLNRFVHANQNFGAIPGNAYLNFNGGTLKASANNASLTPALTLSSNFIPVLTAVYVNGPFGANTGGAVIDTAGQDCIVSAPLLAPTGSGVSTIPVTDGGSGYIGAPYVSIAADGIGATAVANMVDDGTGKGTFKIGSITVCNPGTDYYSPSVTLIGGGAATPATLGTPTTAANTSGGLTKTGTGSLTLLGANTFTGNSVVNQGRLIVSSAHIGGGSFSAADGASFGVLRDPAAPTLLTPVLTLGAGQGAELEFVLPDGNPAAEVITVGTLNLNGTSRITVSGANFTVDTFPLIKYTTLNGDPALLANQLLKAPDGTLAEVIHNASQKRFDLHIIAVSGALKWRGTISTGGVGLWDNQVTANWANNGTPKVFIPGAETTLDDSAPGVTTIGLVGLIEPGVLFADNSSKNYLIGGSGTLGGEMSLNKTGTGTLTLTNTSTYAGATTVSNGTLVISGSLSNSAGPVIINGGTFTAAGRIQTGAGAWSAGSAPDAKSVINLNSGAAVELSANFILGSVSGGVAALNINGGTLTNLQATAASNFEIATSGYGALNMSGGLVRANTAYFGGSSGTSVSSISGGSVIIGNPGTTTSDYILVGASTGTGVLTVNGGLLNHSNVNRTISVNNSGDARGELNLLSGAIDNSGGAISYGYNSGTGNGTGIVNLNGGNLTLNRFISKKQNGVSGAPGNSYLNFNGGTLTVSPSTLTSPGQSFSKSLVPLTMTAVYVNGPFGAFPGGAVIDTAGQDCIVEAALMAPVGGGVRALAVADGGSGYIGAPYVSITGDGTGATAVANMVSDGSGGLKVGSVTVSNPGVNYSVGGASYSFVGGAPSVPATPGSVTVAANTSGGLTKNGLATLELAGTNTYTGATLVNAGGLVINGVLDAGSAVTVNGGALGGSGIIGGPVSVQSGVLSPGGTLTINNTLGLAPGSSTLVRVNASAAQSDLVQGITSASYGGTLIVTNVAGTLTQGQTFQIFSASSRNNTFNSIQSADGAATWSFNPDTGVLTVVSSVASYPTNITFSISGSTMGLDWPSSHAGWFAQSNAVNVADSAAWHDIPGSEGVTHLDITVQPGVTNVFYRLRKP